MSMCPFATDPDATGCDCECELVNVPEGFLARLLWFVMGNSLECISGKGGCGDGSLPCERYDKWRKEHE